MPLWLGEYHLPAEETISGFNRFSRKIRADMKALITQISEGSSWERSSLSGSTVWAYTSSTAVK